MAKRIDLCGHQFGILIVKEFVGVNERRQALYRCECLCGEIRIVRRTELTSMAVRRCGSDCTYEPPKMRFTFGTIYDGKVETHFEN